MKTFFNIWSFNNFICPGGHNLGVAGPYTSVGFRPHLENVDTTLQVYLCSSENTLINLKWLWCPENYKTRLLQDQSWSGDNKIWTILCFLRSQLDVQRFWISILDEGYNLEDCLLIRGIFFMLLIKKIIEHNNILLICCENTYDFISINSNPHIVTSCVLI